MDLSFLSQINYGALAVTSLALFVIGWIWFSVLFGHAWSQELAKHNVTIKTPSSSDMICKMLLSLTVNIITAFGMAYLVIKTGSTDAYTGACLGLVAAISFAATTLASAFIWESRSLKLYLIDIGYSALNIIVAGIILSIWR